MAEEKDYENIPANEWDYDESDLLTKLDSYMTDAYNSILKEEQDNIARFFARELLEEGEVFCGNARDVIPDAILKESESNTDFMLRAFAEIFDMIFEWCEEDQCYYEDVMCL